jgi:hypothetical protein
MRVLFVRHHATEKQNKQRRSDSLVRVSLAMTIPKSPANDRGVYVEEIPPPGEHWYKIVLSIRQLNSSRRCVSL